MQKVRKTIPIDPEVWDYVKKTAKAQGVFVERRVAELLEAGIRAEAEGEGA